MMLVFLAVFWLAGLVLGLLVEARPLPLLLLFVATFPMGIFFFLNRWPLVPVIMAALLLAAFWRVEVLEQPAPELAVQDTQQVVLTGWVRDDPEAAGGMFRFVLTVDTVDRGDGPLPLSSRVLVYAEPPGSLVDTRRPPFFAYGDRLELRGVLERPKPFQGFDYPDYLASKGISGVLWSRDAMLDATFTGKSPPRWRGWLFGIRQRLANNLEESLPAPHAALAQALLLGLRGDIPPKVIDDFRQTGTSHLLAISGLHVGVLLLLVLAFVGWTWGRRLPVYVLAPLAAIWMYALVSGMPVSVIRAGIMGSILLAGWALGRPHRILPALALAAAVMAGLEPKVLGQVSFQLSFAAVAGIALALPFQPRMSEFITLRVTRGGYWWQPGAGIFLAGVATSALISLAATLATWPLVAFHFQRIPWVGIPATMLALPVLPFALVGAFSTAMLGLAHPVLGQILGWVTWIPLTYLLELVSWMPHLTSPGSWVGTPLVLAWYGVLGGLVLLPGGLGRVARVLGWKTEPIRGAVAGVSGVSGGTPSTIWARIGAGLVGLALAAAVLLWWQFFNGPDGKLHVYFFDVGQGDSTLIVTPLGKQILVDGGAGSLDAVQSAAGAMPTGDRSIDLVVLTHLDADHSRGLFEVLDRFRVGRVLNGVDYAGAAMYPQWAAALDRSGVEPMPVEIGYRIELEPELTLEVLNPQRSALRFPAADLNNNAVVLRLVYRDVSMLLAADIEAGAESLLVKSGATLASNVLKVAHHGSQTSSTMGFLREVNPDLAIISVGSGNRHGHPDPGVLSRLVGFVGEDGVYRTDLDGSIELISDGIGLWVKAN